MPEPPPDPDPLDLPPLPYKIAALCFLFDAQGRTLLLHRAKPPNLDLYSPIGGKLEQAQGESPTRCAQREIYEEAGLEVAIADLHLTGIVSEQAFEGKGHWLMFLYEVTRPVDLAPERMVFDEGRLEWHDPGAIPELAIPESDREVIWPLFWQHRGGFFAAHLDCTGSRIAWTLEQSSLPAGA
ncbi:NUDIX domain-containing protein [Phycisphaeraceae bacterium D3-23]